MPIFDVSHVEPQLIQMLGARDGRPLLDVLRVSADVASVREARGFVSQTLGALKVAESVVEDAVLIVSELVTNAVLHGGGVGGAEATVRLVVVDALLQIEVHDASPAAPVQCTASDDADSGRGLAIVAALADRWGWEPTPDGKFVWCELSAWPEQTTTHHA